MDKVYKPITANELVGDKVYGSIKVGKAKDYYFSSRLSDFKKDGYEELVVQYDSSIYEVGFIDSDKGVIKLRKRK